MDQCQGPKTDDVTNELPVFQKSGEPTELELRLNDWGYGSVSGWTVQNGMNLQVSFFSIMRRLSQQAEKITAQGRVNQDAALNEAVLRE